MNKTLLLSLAVASFVVATFAFVDEVSTQRQFMDFVRKYNKNYETEEVFQRYENFKASLARVEQRNLKSKNKVFGITKFSDMTPEEFQTTILMKNKIDPSKKLNPQNVIEPKVKSVPASFDWRDKGAVTAVKDQEQCGSCWAFSITENIESMWILAGKATNETIALAPQQVVDCDDSDAGCDGGEPNTAYEYVISAGGLESESTYPYIGEDGSCNFNSSEIVASIQSWKWATEYSETTLQANLVSWGPLSVCVDAESWQDYSSGVMSWTECAYINILDHCVQLVGYNAEDSDNSYWIVRNSWNTDWGIDGYIWLEMWEDTCGITHEASCSFNH